MYLETFQALLTYKVDFAFSVLRLFMASRNVVNLPCSMECSLLTYYLEPLINGEGCLHIT